MALTRVFVPCTDVQPGTRVALLGYEPEYVDVSADRHAYWRYFADRWAAGETFISCEHDVVPWPGALESLTECPEPWCAFGYSARDDFGAPLGPPLVRVPRFSVGVPKWIKPTFPGPYVGLVKFTDAAIAATAELWTEAGWEARPEDLQSRYYRGGGPRGNSVWTWGVLDQFVAHALRRAGVECHQHRPAVTNVNPALLRWPEKELPPWVLRAGRPLQERKTP